MIFHSLKYKALIVTLDPRTHVIQNGTKIMKGLTGQYPQGRSIEFVNGVYETTDKKEIKLLKANPGYGVSFVAQGDDDSEEVQQKMQATQAQKKAAAERAADTAPQDGGGDPPVVTE